MTVWLDGYVTWPDVRREEPMGDGGERLNDGGCYFAQCRPGTFAADTSMFTGEPTIGRGVAAEETTVLAVPPGALVAGSEGLGDTAGAIPRSS